MVYRETNFNNAQKLAQEERRVNSTSSGVIISFLLLITVPAVFIYVLSGITYVKADSLVLSEEKRTSNYLNANNISVTAVVPERMGYKLIDIQNNIRSLNIFGNYEKGFRVENIQTGETIYEQNTMPGDGVYVRLKDSINYLLHPKE